MSSYAGRYRSRLLNFLSQQTHRWIDKGDLALRHIKVGAIWGTQILLYPVYLMFQAARLVGQQLQQALQYNIAAAKNMPPADRPVQLVLEKAIASSPTAELSEDSPQQQVFRGIACSLETQDLVLVTASNQIADIFDRTQQQEIEKLISLELSDYLHHQIVAKEIQPKITNRLPLLEDRPQLIPPIRFFRKVMAWVQTSPVATLVNLFQEEAVLLNLEVKTKYLKQKSQILKSQSARLKAQSEELNRKHQSSTIENGELSEINPPALIGKLDRAIAELETKNLAVVVKVTDSLAHRRQEFLGIVKSRFGDSSHLDPATTRTLDDPPGNFFTIQALIKGAIDYFFGKNENIPLPSPAPTEISGSGEVATEEENPWLTESDLFGEPVVIKPRPKNTNQKNYQFSQKVTLPTKKTDYLMPGKLKTKYSKSGLGNQTGDRESLATQMKQKLSRSQVVPVSATTPNSSPNIERDREDFYYYHSEEDSIEIKAKSIGYVKHPLEQILHWLDSAMLWLEDLIVKIWHSVLGR